MHGGGCRLLGLLEPGLYLLPYLCLRVIAAIIVATTTVFVRLILVLCRLPLST